MAPIEVPLEDLEANHPPETNRQAIQFHNRHRFECNNCFCSCTDYDDCGFSSMMVLFAILATIILIFRLSKA